tara:strand:+ start:2197 stop:2835 length:639 start_codon:yes stop_codon:yes gene_type:complete
MRDMNEIKILGTVTQEVRVNPTKSGSVANVSVVTTQKRGEYDIKKFHSITCWNDLSDEASKLKTGDRVFVGGRMDTEKYEKDGQTIYKDKITASVIARVASQAEESGTKEVATSQPPASNGPPVSFSGGGGNQSAFPYVDMTRKVSWPTPDESGFSYADKGGDSLCVSWADPAKPSDGGTVYQYNGSEWEPTGKVPTGPGSTKNLTDKDIPF